MENTQGFYKFDGDLLYAPNSVLNSQYKLLKDNHKDYTYPVDGWYWFDSGVDAYEFFGLPIENIEQ